MDVVTNVINVLPFKRHPILTGSPQVPYPTLVPGEAPSYNMGSPPFFPTFLTDRM